MRVSERKREDPQIRKREQAEKPDMRPADTPERQEDLRSVPPHRIVTRTKDGNVVYTYADPDNCHCVFVGGDKDYSEYERLRVTNEAARRFARLTPAHVFEATPP